MSGLIGRSRIWEKQLGFFQLESFAAARRRLAASRLTEDGTGLRPWDPEAPPVSAFEVLDFYEHLGLLVKKGHLEIYDVWHTFYEWAQPVYVDLKAMIEDQASAYSEHYSDLRRLMRGMDEIQLARMHAQNGNHWALWTEERILEHYRYELEAAGGSARAKRAAERAAERATRRREEEAARREEWMDLDAEAAEVLEGEAGVAVEAAARASLAERQEQQGREEREMRDA